MNTVAQPDAARLLELLTQQRDLYRSLRDLSEQQRALIAGDRPEMLLNILRERQDLVTRLARLNEDLGPYRRNWDAFHASLPEAHRNQASALLHEINALLRTILRTDQEDGALLSARKQAVQAQIGGVADGRAANAAYAAQPRATPPSAANITG
jgi:hypothetical protein